MRFRILVGLLLIVVLLGGGGSGTDISDCATLSTVGDTYYLTANITDSANTTCMTITAENITLDCQGHTIDGVPAPSTTGITTEHNNTNIKNCIVTDWWTGIYIDSSHNNLSNLTLNSNLLQGVCLHWSKYVKLTNITANSHTFGVGVYLQDADNNTLRDITANSNKMGVHLIAGSNNNTLINITTNSNTENGMYIEASLYNTLTHITANSNTERGVGFYGGANYNTVSNSIANSNGDMGFSLNSVASAYITLDNITSRSNQWGVYLEAFGGHVVKNSVIQDNSVCGVYLNINAGVAENRLYNNLFNNTVNTYFADSRDGWWNTTRQIGVRIYSDGLEIGGNYYTNSTGNGYSDTCTDSNSDGFCDDQYNLSGTTNIDYLPLSDGYSSDSTSPNITLNWPQNKTKTKDRSPGINFTATDDTAATLSCSLYLNGVLNTTNSSVINGTATIITPTGNLSSKWWNFSILCDDGSGNTHQTGTYWVEVRYWPFTAIATVVSVVGYLLYRRFRRGRR